MFIEVFSHVIACNWSMAHNTAYLFPENEITFHGLRQQNMHQLIWKLTHALDFWSISLFNCICLSETFSTFILECKRKHYMIRMKSLDISHFCSVEREMVFSCSLRSRICNLVVDELQRKSLFQTFAKRCPPKNLLSFPTLAWVPLHCCSMSFCCHL